MARRECIFLYIKKWKEQRGKAMSATKMNAQEIIKFIADAKKKTPVKVIFDGELRGSIPWSVVKLSLIHI